MEKTVINVKGMHCGHCEAAVSGAIAGLAGVEKAKADSKSGTVKVKYNPAAVSLEDMKKAVADVGFEAE
jgi:Copper chaperone